MLVDVWTDKRGSVYADPKSKRLKARIIQHLFDAGVRSNGIAFFQSEEEVPDCILMPPGFKDSVEKGWTLTMRLDDYEFLNCYGYDAHTLAE
jgi:hypothetical protein